MILITVELDDLIYKMYVKNGIENALLSLQLQATEEEPVHPSLEKMVVPYLGPPCLCPTDLTFPSHSSKDPPSVTT